MIERRSAAPAVRTLRPGLLLCAAAASLLLTACQNGDPTRAGLEYRRVRVAPETTITEAPDPDTATPLRGQSHRAVSSAQTAR